MSSSGNFASSSQAIDTAEVVDAGAGVPSDRQLLENYRTRSDPVRSAFRLLGDLLHHLPDTDHLLFSSEAVAAWRALRDADSENFMVYRSAVRRKCGQEPLRLLDARIGLDAAAATTIWSFAPLDARRAMLEPPAPVRWFAKNYLLQGRAHLLSGLGGSSKTKCLTQIGFGAVAGQMLWPWVIPSDAQGPSLLLLAEDVEEETRRSLYAVARALQLSPRQAEHISKQIEIYSLAGKDVDLLHLTPEGALFRAPLYDALCNRAKAIGARFIGLDPAIRFTQGDEMDTKHQRVLGDTADALAIETGACVVMNTHASKATRSSEDAQSHLSRGAGSITDAVRAEFALQGMTTKEAAARGMNEIAEQRRYVCLRLVKANHAPPEAFEPLWLKRTDHGVLVDATDDLPEAQIRQTAFIAERTIKAWNALWEVGNGDHVPIGRWRERCVAEKIITANTKDSQESAMKLIAKQLLGGNMVVRNAAGKATTYMPRQSAERFANGESGIGSGH